LQNNSEGDRGKEGRDKGRKHTNLKELTKETEESSIG
jgi:hypothetical protein